MLRTFILSSLILAGAEQCWSSLVKSALKLRDEATLGPLSDDLKGLDRIKAILKDGAPSTMLGASLSEGERISLNIVCKCANKPRLTSDGNYIAGRIGLREVECSGLLPYSQVRYEVEEEGTCFVAAVRASQRNRPVVSSFLLSSEVVGRGVGQPSATKDGRHAGRIFRKGEFRLGLYGYSDVCNTDIAVEERPVGEKKIALQGKQPLPSRFVPFAHTIASDGNHTAATMTATPETGGEGRSVQLTPAFYY